MHVLFDRASNRIDYLVVSMNMTFAMAIQSLIDLCKMEIIE